MKNFFAALFLLGFAISASAQETRLGLGYSFISAKQWDRAIQVNNFSRPFIENKQPFIRNGITASFSHIFKSSKNIHHGFQIAYSYARSNSVNQGLENTLNLHLFSPGYILHIENGENGKGFYSEAIISAPVGLLFRNVNGEPFVFDDAVANAPGIGGDLHVRAGYKLSLAEKISISPFLDLGYSPFFYSPNTEILINQTKTMAAKTSTSIFSAQAGLALHFYK